MWSVQYSVQGRRVASDVVVQCMLVWDSGARNRSGARAGQSRAAAGSGDPPATAHHSVHALPRRRQPAWLSLPRILVRRRSQSYTFDIRSKSNFFWLKYIFLLPITLVFTYVLVKSAFVYIFLCAIFAQLSGLFQVYWKWSVYLSSITEGKLRTVFYGNVLIILYE